MRGEGYWLSDNDDQGSGANRGSPEPRFLVIGKVLGAWGVKGEIKVEIMTGFPERFALLQRVYLEGRAEPYNLERFRLHGKRVLLKLEGCSDRNAAEKLRGQLVQIPIEKAMPLGEDEYYLHQILGLTVWTTDGECLGVVREILFTGSNEVYVVQGEGREILIPALEDVVLEVDLEGQRLIVQLMEGLISG
ncbi:MAG: ribosome maturation factor RimM [Anaerolineae bacterium]